MLKIEAKREVYIDGGPTGDPILEEVVTEDCYGLRELDPFPRLVVDGGACFGAFSFFAWALGADSVCAMEPDPRAQQLFRANQERNAAQTRIWRGPGIWLDPFALALRAGKRHFVLGAGLGQSLFGPHPGIDVETITLPPAPFPGRFSALLKLDVEGAERELFHHDNLPVIASYDYIVMEWHNFDGALYASILKQLGFVITRLEGGDRTPWDPTIGGGVLTARKGV
jgi:FkbM family methyltransferase